MVNPQAADVTAAKVWDQNNADLLFGHWGYHPLCI
jgi:hypothetical protein